MRAWTWTALIAGSFIGITACGDGGSTLTDGVAGEAIVRDSGGVRIVENHAPSWAAGTGWRLADSPRLDLGSLDGPEAMQFFQISDGAWLSDGGFVVSGFGSHDLRRFASDGRHVWTAGREGDGPGEFRGLMSVAAGPGDTLLTYDFRHRRISRWAPDGSFLDARALEGVEEGGFPFVQTLLPDGRAVYSFLYFAMNELPAPGEVRRDPIEVRIAAPGDSVALPLGEFPGTERVIMRQSETASGARVISGSPPFARVTATAADPAGVWVGDSDLPQVLRYDMNGKLVAVVQLPFEPVPVTPDLVARALAEQLDEADDQEERDLARQRWEELPLPEFLPWFEDLVVDRAGNLWVRAYQAPGVEIRTWHVFTTDGEWLGAVEFPDRFSPLEIGDEFVLARFGDELDVEHVQIRELIKP
jgi:hypothetical protein